MAYGARCHSKQEACSEVAKQMGLRGLTFDMSGGPKGAKRPLERPLDGGVRRHPLGCFGVEFDAESFGYFQHGGEAGISLCAERPVQTLSTQARIFGHLCHAFGASDIA